MLRRIDPKKEAPAQPPSEVLLRGLVLLEALNERQVSHVDRLATATGLPKPTVVRMLKMLVQAGYARRLPHRRGYTLGSRVAKLSQGFNLEDAIAVAALPAMTSFTTKHKWPVSLSTRDGHSMRVREATVQISPLASSGDESLVGRRVGFLHSAVGRAYLAFCPEREQEAIIKMLDGRVEISPAVSLGNLRSLVRSVARAGYAFSPPMPGDPAIGLAVPIFHEGRLGACLTLRYLGRAISQREVVRRYLDSLLRTAADISSATKVV